MLIGKVMKKIILVGCFCNCFYMLGMTPDYSNNNIDENSGVDVNENAYEPEHDVTCEYLKYIEKEYYGDNLYGDDVFHNIELQDSEQLLQGYTSYLNSKNYDSNDWIISDINNFCFFVMKVNSMLKEFNDIMREVHVDKFWRNKFISVLARDLNFLDTWSESMNLDTLSKSMDYDIIKCIIKYLFYKSTFLNIYFDLCGDCDSDDLDEYHDDTNDSDEMIKIIFRTFFNSKFITKHENILLEELKEGYLYDSQTVMQDNINDYVGLTYKGTHYYMRINEKVNGENNPGAVCSKYIADMTRIFITMLESKASNFKFINNNSNNNMIEGLVIQLAKYDAKKLYLYLCKWYTELYCVAEFKKKFWQCHICFSEFKKSIFLNICKYILNESYELRNNMFNSVDEADKFFTTVILDVWKKICETCNTGFLWRN